jgi:hypothetical protein
MRSGYDDLITVMSAISGNYRVNREMRRAMGLPVREDIRNRVLIAAGELNRELDQKELARIADDLAECAMMLREIGK